MDLYAAKTPQIAVPSASIRTLLQIATPATIRGRLANLAVSFDGSTALQALWVELLYQTTAGTGGTAVTPGAADPAAPASLVTALYNTSGGEPTAGTVIKGWHVRPDGGSIDIPFYGERMHVVPVSGRLALRVTSASGVTPNAEATMDFWA